MPEEPCFGILRTRLRTSTRTLGMARPARAPLRTPRALRSLLLACLTLSCGGLTPPNGAAVARIETTPSTLSLLVDDSRNVVARAFDASGALLSRPLFWSVDVANVVTVTQDGVLTAIAPGTAQLAVSAGGKSVLVPVTVSVRPVAVVRIAPEGSTIRVGQSAQLSVQLFDAGGNELSGRTVTWSTSAATLATVSALGRVTGVAAGTVTITATAEGVNGTALVVVQPIPVASVALTPATVAMLDGASTALTAVPRDSAGKTLTGRTITWSSSAPGVATVSSSGGLLGVAPGTATITATSEGKSATSRVTVSPVPVATVTVSPSTATVVVGQTATLTARVADSSGTLLSGRTVAWTSDAPAVATVNASTGLVTTIATGTAKITATSEGKSGVATISVPIVPVASIQVTPASLTMLAGETQRLTAKTLDAQGKVLTGRVVTWIGGAPAVATVDTLGNVRAIAIGSAVIVATSEGARVSVPVSVVPITVAKVNVTPAAPTMESGRSLQLTASILDIRGRAIAGKSATWTSSNTSAATVSSSGRVTANIPGTTTITATSDGVSGSATVTVTLVKLARITLTPATASLYAGASLEVGMQLTDAVGHVLTPTGRTIVWASSAPAVASVSPLGVVTAVAAGTATISVTVDGQSASLSVTVSEVPVRGVVVDPSGATLTVGATVQLSAKATDALGNVIAGRTATWSSSAPSIATVDATGRVRGVAVGTARVTATIDGVQSGATIVVNAK